ncbi:hypothetical protein CHISP_0937 [Chitinispirillum alkaliphilum]|nr:hypothetical protein CHISP_0937 [Chitinispirillum alkaliphilum]
MGEVLPQHNERCLHKEMVSRLTGSWVLIKIDFLIFAVFVLLTPATIRAGENGDTFFGSVIWSSSYISEGIDNLPERQVVQAEIGYSIADFIFSGVILSALTERYAEFSIAAEYGFEIGTVDISAGVATTFLNNLFTVEVGALVSKRFESGIFVDFESVSDLKEVKGGFYELSTGWDIELFSQKLSVTPFALLGIDWGIVRDQRTLQINHYSFGIENVYVISDAFAFFLTLETFHPLANLKDIDQTDHLWNISAGFEIEL